MLTGNENVYPQPNDSETELPEPNMSEQLREQQFPPIKWAVPGLVPDGVTFLAGKPKMGKSWMALNIACAIAAGGKALSGINVEQGEVMCLSLEDNLRRLKKRANIVTGNNIPAGIHFFTDWPRMDELGLEYLDKYLDKHPAIRLVIVDTLQRIKPRTNGGNPYGDDYDAVGSLHRIAHLYGVSILVVHHLRKMGSDDPMDQISGTLGLTGAADGMLVLTRERGRADAVLHVTGRDIEEDGEYALEWVKDVATWAIMGHKDELQPSREREKVLQCLREEGELSNKKIAEYLSWDYDNVRKLTARMADEATLKIISGDRKIGYVYGVPTYTNYPNLNE